MCPFVETICIADGTAMNLHLHAQRLNRTRQHFWPGCEDISEHHLQQLLAQCLLQLSPDAPPSLQSPRTPYHNPRVKARLVYDERGIIDCTTEPYTMRQLETLKMVAADDLGYAWKSTDRSALTHIRAMAPEADEVIIVKHGCITDTSYTNLCFFDGTTWLTPDTPLLPGTMRRHLLDSGIIRERRILATDIPHFQQVALINAMIPLGDLVLPTTCIMPGK